MRNEFILRRATLGDCDIVAALAERTFRETFVDDFAMDYPAVDLATFVHLSYAPHVFAASLIDPDQAIWLTLDDETPVGYAHAGPCRLPHPEVRPDHGELYRLYVARERQGLGLGRRLMDAALAWLDRDVIGPVWLGAWSGNLKAHAFYAAYDFEKVGDYLFSVGATFDHEFIFRRSPGDRM